MAFPKENEKEQYLSPDLVKIFPATFLFSFRPFLEEKIRTHEKNASMVP